MTVCIVDTNTQSVYVAHLGDSRAIVFQSSSSSSCIAAREGRMLRKDSSLISTSGQQQMPEDLSSDAVLVHVTEDHNPSQPRELQRIASVLLHSSQHDPFERISMLNGRVLVGDCSSLNVSRTLGDHDFKRVKGLSQSHQPVCAVVDFFHMKFPPRQSSTSRAFGTLDNRLWIFIASDGIWNGGITAIQRPSSLRPSHRSTCQSSRSLEDKKQLTSSVSPEPTAASAPHRNMSASDESHVCMPHSPAFDLETNGPSTRNDNPTEQVHVFHPFPLQQSKSFSLPVQPACPILRTLSLNHLQGDSCNRDPFDDAGWDWLVGKTRNEQVMHWLVRSTLVCERYSHAVNALFDNIIAQRAVHAGKSNDNMAAILITIDSCDADTLVRY